MKKLIPVFLCCFTFFSYVHGQEKTVTVDSLRINSDELMVDFRVDSLLDKSVVEGLDRGLTVSVSYQIELWRQRSNWFDQNVDYIILTFTLSYNTLDDRYVFQSRDERRTTGLFWKALKLLSEQKEIFITTREKLKPNNIYYLEIKGRVKPLSVENLNEISQWLKGEVESVDLNKIKEPKGTGKSLRNHPMLNKNLQFQEI